MWVEVEVWPPGLMGKIEIKKISEAPVFTTGVGDWEPETSPALNPSSLRLRYWA